MANVLDQLRTFYVGLEPARRRVLHAATALSVVAVGGVAIWAAQPDNVVLTRASDPDEAQTIARALAQAELPYTIDADGVTVRVPRVSQVEARRAASGDQGIVGLEGLDQIDPWVTPFQEQLHRVRMIQGELVRTLNAITGIASSTVHITFPERTAFLGDTDRPSAAVTLRPDAGTGIERTTARSVAELVSHAVAGMTADDVTVVDASSGRLLWSGGLDPDGAGGEGDLSVLAAKREAELSEGVRAALAHLLGNPEAATVTVHVDLDRSETQSTVSAVDPDSAVTTAERVETESDARTSSTPSGVPGTDSNLPERAATGGAGSSTGRTRETQQTTYQFTTTTTITSKPAGDIRRLTASVMIDQKAVKAAAAGGDDASLRSQLEAGVKAALGSNEARGDTVVVSFLPFAAIAADDTLAVAEPASSEWERFIPAGVVAAAILAVFAFLVRPLLAALRPPVAAPAVVGAAADAAADADETDDPDDGVIHLDERLRARIAGLDAHHPKDVSDLVRQESVHSAEVLRRWIRT